MMGETPIGLLSTTVKPDRRPSGLESARLEFQSSNEHTDRPTKKGKSIFGNKFGTQTENVFRTSTFLLIGNNLEYHSKLVNDHHSFFSINVEATTPIPAPLLSSVSLGGPLNDQLQAERNKLRIQFGDTPIGLLTTTRPSAQRRPTEMDLARQRLVEMMREQKLQRLTEEQRIQEEATPETLEDVSEKKVRNWIPAIYLCRY